MSPARAATAKKAASEKPRRACRSTSRSCCARPSGASGAPSANGVWPVAGCDEAGRGPLAGPVVAAAVVLDPERIPRGLNDSKKLDAGRAREALRQDLRHARRWRSPSARSSASTATISCAPRCGRWRARSRRCRAGRNWSSSTATSRSTVGCDCEAVVSGDALVALDRGGLDRRQGHARPADGAARPRASGLRLRAAHGLQRAGAFRALARARADHPSPQTLCAGGGQARPTLRTRTSSIGRLLPDVVASFARLLYSLAASVFTPARANALRLPDRRIPARASRRSCSGPWR